MRLSILGKDSKTKDEKPLGVVDAYVKENTTELVDPLDVKKKLEALEEKRNTLLTELDTQIGLVEYDIRKSKDVDIIAFAGHKSLYGPFGVGGFINVTNVPLDEFIVGGTGSDSLSLEMPMGNETRYESASSNIIAIAGLKAALDVLNVQAIYQHEKELTNYLIMKLSSLPNVKVFLPSNKEQHIGIVSFVVDGYKSDDVGMILDEDYNIAVRTGYHAKTYIVDDKRGIVGSANATKSGLTGNASGNAEMATLVEIEQQDKEKIEKLFVEAIEVEEKLVDEFSKQLNAVKDTSKIESAQWSKEIRELFHPNIETLFSYELPEKTEYQSGDYIQFLDAVFGDDSEVIKEKFRWSNAYLWLLNVIEKKGGVIYFGELSAELHNALIEDPKPYRKDVKILLVNMLSLIEAWNMEEIIVDRPNFSQRIRLNKKN